MTFGVQLVAIFSQVQKFIYTVFIRVQCEMIFVLTYDSSHPQPNVVNIFFSVSNDNYLLVCVFFKMANKISNWSVELFLFLIRFLKLHQEE